MANVYAYEPDYAVPPGETLRELLEMKGISQADLGVRTGMAEKTISQIINAVAPITYETADKFEMALGVPARFWNRRESSYRESLTRIEETKRLAQDVAWLKGMPVSELIARKKIQPESNKAVLVRQVLKFFGVSSVENWQEKWLKPQVMFRGAKAQQAHPGYVAAWLRLGEIEAESRDCVPYDAKKFRAALDEILKLSSQPSSVWYPAMIKLCAAAGVAVVFVKEIPGASVNGTAKWLTKDKALIQLSLKHKRDDQVWFTFFHEAAHILLHSKKSTFIDNGNNADTKEEREANEFTRDLLIPPSRAHELPHLRSRDAIGAFAGSLSISPGIVVGRLQHDKLIKLSHCNDLKRILAWPTDETDATDD